MTAQINQMDWGPWGPGRVLLGDSHASDMGIV